MNYEEIESFNGACLLCCVEPQLDELIGANGLYCVYHKGHGGAHSWQKHHCGKEID